MPGVLLLGRPESLALLGLPRGLGTSSRRRDRCRHRQCPRFKRRAEGLSVRRDHGGHRAGDLRLAARRAGGRHRLGRDVRVLRVLVGVYASAGTALQFRPELRDLFHVADRLQVLDLRDNS